MEAVPGSDLWILAPFAQAEWWGRRPTAQYIPPISERIFSTGAELTFRLHSTHGDVFHPLSINFLIFPLSRASAISLLSSHLFSANA